MAPLVLPVNEARELDRRAALEFGIPTLLLMENAGRTVAERVVRLFQNFRPEPHVIVLCGGGSNGGDGFVIARHLFQRDIAVTVFLTVDPEELKGDAGLNYRIIKHIGVDRLPFADFQNFINNRSQHPMILVDAMLGTGLHGPLRMETAEIIRQLNAWKKSHRSKVSFVSVDIPSGLSGDDGPVYGEVVKADITCTLACIKPGLVKPESKIFVGQLEVIDIGIPKRLLVATKPARHEPESMALGKSTSREGIE